GWYPCAVIDQTGSKTDALGHYVSGVAAFTLRPPRHNFRAPADPGDAKTVVTAGGDRAGHMAAVPGAGARGIVVARIVRVGVNSVTITGNAGAADKVVTGYQFRGQVWMVHIHPRVNHRHNHFRRGFASAQIPGLRQVNSPVMPLPSI